VAPDGDEEYEEEVPPAEFQDRYSGSGTTAIGDHIGEELRGQARRGAEAGSEDDAGDA
jgi:hypothetical protein